jgi:hypothetical protein
MVRDLLGTIEAEGAPIGVLFTMHEPTRDMSQAAAAAGTWRPAMWDDTFDRIQLISVEEAFAGKRPQYPRSGKNETLQPAPKDHRMRPARTGTLPGVSTARTKKR